MKQKILLLGMALTIFTGCVNKYTTSFLTFYEAKALLQQGKAIKCYNPNNFNEEPVIISGTSNLQTLFIANEHFFIQGSTTANAEFCLKK